MKRTFIALLLAAVAAVPTVAADPPKNHLGDPTAPLPIPLTRLEMKQYIEDMKVRTPRIPLPELTADDKEKLGDRVNSYEARLRHHYMPGQGDGRGGFGFGGGGGGRGDTPNPEMTLDNTFKVQLFWIVCRTNNCQYCQGHQEGKLLRAGQTEDQIAALDGDWSEFTEAQRTAFTFGRKYTYEPHKLNDADIDGLRKFYKDEQILEMILSMAGNNAINRWKEGTGVPQSAGGGGFGGKQPADEPKEKHTYLTPTSEKYAKTVSKVAPLATDEKGQPTRQTLFRRPALEGRDEVEKGLAAAATRKPRLPLQDDAKTKAAMPEDYKGATANWMRLLATFPTQGKSRIASQIVAEDKGDLKPLLKAQVSWIVARQDRAWYATGVAKKKLAELGQTDEQIYKLDGDWSGFTAAERAQFTLAKKLAASPVVLTDVDVAEAVKQVGPRDVTQLISYVTTRASFDRITEAAGLPTD